MPSPVGGRVKRKLILVSLVLVLLLAGGYIGVRWGGRYVAENYIIPRATERFDVELQWDEVDTRVGSATISNLDVAIEDLPEVHLSIDEVTVTYDLWAMLRGKIDILNVRLVRPVVSLEDLSRDVLDRVEARLQRTSEVAGNVTSTGGSAARSPALAIDGARVEIRNCAETSILIEEVNLLLSSDGHMDVDGQSWEFREPQADELIIQGGRFRLSGAREGGNRLSVDEVDLAGIQYTWQWGDSEPTLISAFRRVRQSMSASDDSEAHPPSGESEGPRRPTSLSRLQFPPIIEIENSSFRIRLPDRDDDEDERLLELGNIDGRIFTGSDSEPPTAEFEGQLQPDSGRVEIEVSINEEGDPRGYLNVTSLNVGEIASGMSVSGFAFSDSSLLDGELIVERGDSGTVSFRGEVTTSGVSFEEELVASSPVSDLRLRAIANGSVNADERRIVLEGARVWLNGIETSWAGNFTSTADRTAFDITAELHQIHCDVLRDSTPEALREHLAQMTLDGVISGRVRLALDTEDLEDLVLDFDIRNGCRAVGSGRLDIDRLQGAFLHRVDLPGDDAHEFRIGPGSGNWAAFGQLSPYLLAAVLTTEDGRFFHHNGFNVREMRRALIRDVEAGRPRFGASTISMQLARNLFLYRRRTLARKLQEAVLTWYLEQNLSKEEILTLYLNIIEFGPHVFGIRHAAMHYFGRQPDDLSPREAVFLAKLLPSPVRGHEQTYDAGELSPRWRARVNRALRVMRDRRALSNEEYQAAMEQRIVFYQQGEALPSHRTWRPRGPFLQRRGIVDDAPPERWLEVETEANIPAPSELVDDL